jgi:hypothetical protein
MFKTVCISKENTEGVNVCLSIYHLLELVDCRVLLKSWVKGLITNFNSYKNEKICGVRLLSG